MEPAFMSRLIILSLVFAVGAHAFDADAIAQAACAASSPGGFVSAIRRTCSGTQASCNTICSNAISGMRAIYGNQGSTTGTCFQAFHFYYKHATLKPEEKGKALLAMHRYRDGCNSTSCGPNFCCCKA
eukprot:XP_011440852.1 PREDICTED: uncharacterized protein LOC105337689 [Crassostrea gigas]